MLRTFGQLSLEGASFQRLKPLLLLAYLAVEGGQDRTTLASLFWPDSEDPLNSLSVTLSRIRQTHRVPVVGNRYAVEVSLETDVQGFLSAAGRGNHKAALDLYQGPFLHGVVLPGVGVGFENWLYDTRESLAAQASRSLLDLAEQKAQAGQHDLAAYYAEAAYNLPAAPPAEAETLHLIHRLLREGGSAVADTVETEARELGISLVSRSAAAPKQTGEPIPNNLTKRQPSFVGREADLDALAAQLADPECRLLTLVGPGGIGKSRLALRLAHGELERRSWEGIYLVPLATLREAELIPLRIAEVLSLSFRGKESPLELVTRFVGEKRLLIVLDNVEHLIEETEILQTLLASCPDLTLLVTSRVRLNLHEEWGVALAGLSYPPPDAPPDDLLTYSAPELFYRRAKQAQGDLTFTAGDASHVAHLCRLVEGSPLALELAAPWLRALSLTDIVRALEQDFGLLVDTRKDKDERHRSMGAVLEHSWGLLSKEEQSALAKLSVFEGGFTREAAADVAVVSLLELTDLIDRSLLRREQEGRYEFHPLTKQFAGQKLGEDERQFAETRSRHLDHFLAFAEAAEPKLTGPEQAAWLNKIEENLENLRAALRLTFEQRLAETSLRLASALGQFWELRGYFEEGREWLSRALSVSADDANLAATRSRMRAIRIVAAIASRQGDYQEALAYLEEGVAVGINLGDHAEVAQCHNVQGSVAFLQADYPAAQNYYRKSLAASRHLGHRLGIARSLYNLGSVAYRLGHSSAAHRHYEESLAISKEIGMQAGVAYALNGLGQLYFEQGDYPKAQIHYRESLAVKRKLGDRQGLANSLNGLGQLFFDKGEYSAAKGYYEESLVIRRELGDPQGVARSLNNLGMIAYEQQDYVTAQNYIEESLLVKRKLNDRDGAADSLINLGNLAYARRDYEAAHRLYVESLALTRKLGNPSRVVSALCSLGRSANVQGHYEDAHRYLSEALGLLDASTQKPQVRCLEELGHLACALRQFKHAVHLWSKASALRAALDMPLPESEQPRHEQSLITVKERLGATAFQTAWEVATSMPLDQIAERAFSRKFVTD